MSVSGETGSRPAALSEPCVPTSPHARAKHWIAALEEVEILKQDKATKQRYAISLKLPKSIIHFCRKTTYYVLQGRAIRCIVVLYTPIEDLISENDRRCESRDNHSTAE